jgi:hypothetical protein
MPAQTEPLSVLKEPMAPESTIDLGLIEAYKATDFLVHSEPPFVLKIGASSPQLMQLYGRFSTANAAFLTAYNPYSEDVGAAQNSAFHDKLCRELTNCGLTFLPGMGQDSQGQWPGEPSYLVLGLQLEEAKAMGTQYRQNALVWCGDDAVPQLILLR